MKIGIVTITGETNYGNRLQNLALQTVISELGFTSETLLRPVCEPLSMTDRLKSFVKVILNHDKYSNLRILKFESFNRKYINQVSKDAYDCDCYVVGSDQVWNLNFSKIRKNIEFYFLQFANKEKRLGFSVSIGTDSVPKEYERDFIKYESMMGAYSVRETAGANYIESVTGTRPPVTLDPTFLVEAEKWRNVAKKPSKVEDEYILTYMMGGIGEETKEYIAEVSKELNLSVVNLYDCQVSVPKGKAGKEFSFSPDEFLWLVDNCRLMITDSFHGCAFSIIFGKPFRWFPRASKAGIDMNSRFKTIFKTLKIDDWCVGDFSETSDKFATCNYEYAQQELKKLKAESLNFLKGILSFDEN